MIKANLASLSGVLALPGFEYLRYLLIDIPSGFESAIFIFPYPLIPSIPYLSLPLAFQMSHFMISS